MIKIKLNKDITLLSDNAIIEDTMISKQHIRVLKEICDNNKSDTVFGLPVSDIYCLSIIYNCVNIDRCKYTEIKISKSIRGALLDNIIVLVDDKGNYGFNAVSRNPDNLVLNGTLTLKTRELNKLKNLLYVDTKLETANLALIREGDKLVIKRNDAQQTVLFSGTPNEVIFDQQDSVDNCWTLGSLTCSSETKESIAGKVDDLFNYKEPDFKNLPIPMCCFDYSYLNFNDMFAKVRSINVDLNNHIIKRDSKEEIMKSFWDMYYARLYMLKASGIDVEETLNYKEIYDNLMLEKNYHRIK